MLSSLIENAVQQEFKEELLAYFFLWQNGKMVCIAVYPPFKTLLVFRCTRLRVAQTEAALDWECERFLTGLNETIDFEVDDALDKLSLDHLVLLHVTGWKEEQTPMYSALPLGSSSDFAFLVHQIGLASPSIVCLGPY